MRTHPPNRISKAWIAAALAALILGSADAGAATQLSAITVSNFSDSVSEFRPRIQGDAIVWQRGSGTGADVMRRDGFVTVNMTSNGVADENPETDGIHIVWQQGSAGQRNIAVYDLITGTTTILASAGDEIFPLVSGVEISGRKAL